MQLGKVHHFASHFPILLYALEKTKGAVLELGSGLFSTPLIHYYCDPRGRKVVTVESDATWYQNVALLFQTANHEIRKTENWKEPDLERHFDVVFIDHAPADQRVVDLVKYANLATFIVIHDTNGRHEKHYHMKAEWSRFKYVYHYGGYFPQTTIASNTRKIGKIC